jgi:tetratricopeptide (TPR) repeat protein
MAGWLLRVVVVLTIVVAAPARGAQPGGPATLALAEALATYRDGDLRAALAKLGTIPDEELNETVVRFCTRDNVEPASRPVRIRIAAALLTEMGLDRLRKSPFAWRDPYLPSARTLIRTLVKMEDLGEVARDQERRFVRDWYLLMVAFHHGRAEIGWTRLYLAEARELFPHDSAVLLVSGSDHELLSHLSTGYLTRLNSDGKRSGESRINPGRELDEAANYLRQAIALAPEVAEARLRLGRVLFRTGDLEGAADELRAALTHATEDNVRYLAWTFLGQVEVDRGDLDSAERCYSEALRVFPDGQIARLARSELAYLKGSVKEAADQVVSMLHMPRKVDPWWMYLAGDWWHLESRLTDMREEALR